MSAWRARRGALSGGCGGGQRASLLLELIHGVLERDVVAGLGLDEVRAVTGLQALLAAVLEALLHGAVSERDGELVGVLVAAPHVEHGAVKVAALELEDAGLPAASQAPRRATRGGRRTRRRAVR